MRSLSFKIIPALILFILLIPSYSWSKNSKVAILPWKVNSAENMDFVKDAMVDMLSSRVAGPSAEVIRPDAVKAAMNEKAEINDKVATEIGKKLKADYVIYGSLTVFGSAISMDAKLLNVNEGATTPFYSKASGMDSVIGLTDKLSSDIVSTISGVPIVKAPEAITTTVASQAVAPAPVPVISVKDKKEDDFIVKTKDDTGPVLWKSRPMDGAYLAMTAVDLNKDGVKELVLLSKKSVIIGKKGAEGLEILKEIKFDVGNGLVSLASIDSDNDGTPELYVSAVKNNKPLTSIVEFRDGEYKITVTGIKWLVRTIDTKKGQFLIGQSFRKGDGFYGKLVVLAKEGSTVVENGPFEYQPPAKMDLYRFEALDTAKGETVLVSLDDRDYIRVYRQDDKKWDKVWSSPDYYGGTLNFIEFSDEKPGAVEIDPVVVEGKFYHVDLNKDGKQELIIKRNVPAGLGRRANRPGSFSSGVVLSLTWDGDFLTENWKTKEIKGYIADFYVDELRDGSKEIYLLVVEGTENLFGAEKSYILSHKLSL